MKCYVGKLIATSDYNYLTFKLKTFAVQNDIKGKIDSEVSTKYFIKIEARALKWLGIIYKPN